MERRHISDKQFETLYNRYLPKLYSAALCLIGDQVLAERITSRAFLETAAVKSYAADERRFAVESARRLYTLSTGERGGVYALPEGFDFLETLPKPFTEMSRSERAIIVFGGLLGFQKGDLERILHIRRRTSVFSSCAG